MSVPEPGTPYKWLCLRTAPFRWDFHTSSEKFMDAVNKIHPSVWQCQFPGDWWEDVVAPTNPDIFWTDEIEQRGDFTNWIREDGSPSVPPMAALGQYIGIETFDPYRGRNHVKIIFNGDAPLDWSQSWNHAVGAGHFWGWEMTGEPYVGLSPAYVRCYVKMTEHTTNGRHEILGFWGIRSGNPMHTISLDALGRLVQDWRDDGGLYSTTSKTVLPMDDRYHCLEISYVYGRGDGEERVWLDGVEVMDLQKVGLFNPGGPTYFHIGTDEAYLFDQGKSTVLYDCCVVSTSYIGPLQLFVPDSWYNYYLPSMVNLTRYCHENGIVCQIVVGNMNNLAGVRLGPDFQWYIHDYYRELSAQGIAPPEWFGLDLEWVTIPASTTEEYRQAIDIIKSIVERYGSRFMLVYAVSGTLQDPLRAVYPWVGNTYYPVVDFYPTRCSPDPLDLSGYEQYVRENGWDGMCLGLMAGILHVEAYPCWTEQNIVRLFDGVQPTSLVGILALDTVTNMIDPVVCPDFAPVVIRESLNRGYILSTVSLNIADPLYAFPEPSAAEVVAKFRETHTACDALYGGGGYWGGAAYQASFSGRIALGYIRYIKTTGRKGPGGVYETRALEALEFLLVGQGTNGPPGYWDDVGYETGIGMRVMAEAYIQYGDARYLQSAIDAGDAVIRENLNLTGNYGAFCVWGLALLYEITANTRYLDKAVEIASRDAGLMNAQGYWPGDHNGRINYHGVYNRGWLELLRVIPLNHPFLATLVDSINRASSHAVTEQHVGGGLYAYPDRRVDGTTDPEGVFKFMEAYMRPIEYFGTIDKTFGVTKVRALINGLVAYILPFDLTIADTMQKIQTILATASAIEYYQYVPPPPTPPIPRARAWWPLLQIGSGLTLVYIGSKAKSPLRG